MVTSLIIHHSSDLDGYGSAVVALQYLEKQHFYIKTKTIPINYGVYDFKRIQKVINKIKKNGYLWVFVLDFSLDANETKWIIDNCDKFIWADHHPTAFPIKKEIDKYLKENDVPVYENVVINNKKKNHFIKFDIKNEKAAIYLIWEMLFPNEPENKYIRYISNLDLWKLDDKEIVNFREFIHKLPWKNYKILKHFIFNKTILKSDIPKDIMNTIINTFGEIFMMRKKEQIEKVSNRFITGYFEQYKTCIVNNTNSEINSEMLNHMCSQKKFDIAISYFDDLVNNLRGFSLRTMRKDIHVGKISSQFGGGGHQKAGGFSMNLKNGVQFIDDIGNGKKQLENSL